ncbi:MAG TPA: hypothetical protein VJT75_13460 [Thermoleophilaceae bacterium]|nr:hypothetical protein [Thermoleophilaceae bacterium]
MDCETKLNAIATAVPAVMATRRARVSLRLCGSVEVDVRDVRAQLIGLPVEIKRHLLLHMPRRPG